MRVRSIAVMASVACGFLLSPAVAQPGGGAPVPPAMRADDGYILGVNDELEVTIFGAGQNQNFKSRIKEDGTITVPFLGQVKATNQTARQLSTSIASQLKSRGVYNDPIVGVEVAQFVSNSVTVFGEVATPGLYPLDRNLTVGMLLARSGGARPGGADYVLLRRRGEEHRILLDNPIGEWSSSTPVLAGDEFFLPVAPTIYIYGQVGSAGAIPIRSDTTVLQALVRAGGPTLAGSKNNITLLRDGKRTKRVDLASKLQNGDVLYIHERLF